MQEIEVKIKLDNPEALMKKVAALGGIKISEQEGLESDIMYNNQAGDFDFDNPTGKHLRLRKAPYGNVFTYKEKGEEHQNLLQRFEIQTKIENFEVMDEILRKIGFYHFRIKEKFVTKFELEGLVLEFHKLPFLGDFLEIEAAENTLDVFLPKLGLSLTKGINKGYSTLFLEYCKQHKIQDDIPMTFEEEKKYASMFGRT
ncbi:MAG: class IV adenylate cyclase [Candidatus Doudnabacteria bacterium]|nr:class IV adenylate cyclase [Candidatus Doudnabacteria bacterium]